MFWVFILFSVYCFLPNDRHQRCKIGVLFECKNILQKWQSNNEQRDSSDKFLQEEKLEMGMGGISAFQLDIYCSIEADPSVTATYSIN